MNLSQLLGGFRDIKCKSNVAPSLTVLTESARQGNTENSSSSCDDEEVIERGGNMQRTATNIVALG